MVNNPKIQYWKSRFNVSPGQDFVFPLEIFFLEFLVRVYIFAKNGKSENLRRKGKPYHKVKILYIFIAIYLCNILWYRGS